MALWPFVCPSREAVEPVHFLAAMPLLAFPLAGRFPVPLVPLARWLPFDEACAPLRFPFVLLGADLPQREVEAVRPELAGRDPVEREAPVREVPGRDEERASEPRRAVRLPLDDWPGRLGACLRAPGRLKCGRDVEGLPAAAGL